MIWFLWMLRYKHLPIKFKLETPQNTLSPKSYPTITTIWKFHPPKRAIITQSHIKMFKEDLPTILLWPWICRMYPSNNVHTIFSFVKPYAIRGKTELFSNKLYIYKIFLATTATTTHHPILTIRETTMFSVNLLFTIYRKILLGFI